MKKSDIFKSYLPPALLLFEAVAAALRLAGAASFSAPIYPFRRYPADLSWSPSGPSCSAPIPGRKWAKAGLQLRRRGSP